MLRAWNLPEEVRLVELRGGADEVTRPVTAVNTLSTPAAAHLPKVASVGEEATS